MNSKNWKNIIVSVNKRGISTADLWAIPSDKNWYLIKLLSGVPNKKWIINVEYRRLFIRQSEVQILKLVDDVGTLEVL